MTFEFKLPDLGEGVAEGEILEWHVAPGDAVSEDDVLAEVETDKAAVDVPSPVDGVVQELRYDVGDVVETGEVFVTIDEEAEAEVGDAEPAAENAVAEETDTAETETTGEATASSKGGRVFAPPNVRRLARELGVEITDVAGSGPSGRITEGDVRQAAESAGEEGESETEAERKDEGGSEKEAEEKQLKSAVRRVGADEEGDDESEDDEDGDDGLQSAISRVDEPSLESEAETEEPAVKSAVKKAGGDREGMRDQTLATPKTRNVARELGVDVDAVPTDETRDGEAYVSEEAVRAYAESETAREQPPAGQEAETADATGTATEGPTAEAGGEEAPQKVVEAPKPTRREPYRGIRRTIGERMAQSRREVPHATHHDQVVVTELVEARERLQPLAEKRDVRLTYLPFVLKSVAAALREHPILNTELDQEAEEIVYEEYYDIGVATATDAGLMVPVVESVDEKGILELASEVNDLVSRARDRSIDRSELQGGTFTVTNFGAIGGEYADPVINVPQTAILGTGALKERPVVEDGEVVAKPTLPLSLAIDHRVIDGADAAQFVNTLKEYLEDPTRLLLE